MKIYMGNNLNVSFLTPADIVQLLVYKSAVLETTRVTHYWLEATIRSIPGDASAAGGAGIALKFNVCRT